MRTITFGFLVVLSLMFLGLPEAQAYVGPGAGMSVLGALWAVLAAVLLAILAVFRWPIRYLWRKLRKKESPDTREEQKLEQ